MRRSGRNIRCVESTSQREPIVMMLRAELTREELKDLKRIAFEKDTTFQALVGAVLSVYISEYKEFS